MTIKPIPHYKSLKSIKNRLWYTLKNFYLAKVQGILTVRTLVPTSEDIIDCFQLPPDILQKTLITSFYNKNISRKVISYQKKVFDLFGLPLIQKTSYQTHACFLEDVLVNSGKEYVIFFDIDAIPLQKEAIFLLLKELTQGFVLAGALQTANHINNGENNYAGPFFLGVHTCFYKQCGYPSLGVSKTFDVAAILTSEANKLSLPVKYWVPTHVEVKKWVLYRIGYFGLGTTYNGLIYHAFEGREGNDYHFIAKCKKILKQFE